MMDARTRILAAAVVVLAVAVPTPATGQGWIEPGVDRSGFAVDRVATDVRVTVEGRVAEVEVTEWFVNRGARVAEGHYLYPLPGEAVFQGFSLFQGETELRGEMMDAAEARAIYEEIVRRRADPALIELAGQGLLRARVFPIEPGQERKVTLRYTQLMGRAGGALEFVYAGGVRPSGALAVSPGPEPLVTIDAPFPRPVPEAPVRRGTAPEAAETSFTLRVADGSDFLDPFSPTHALTVRRERGQILVEAKEQLAGRMSVFLPLAGDVVGLTVAAHRPMGEEGYVMITLSPGRDTGPATPRDVTAVLDVSGSMSGEKIEQARAALRGLLAGLGPSDRFRLVAFSNTVRIESEGWRPVSPAALDDARGWIDRLVADGGTDIGAALDEAFRLEPGADRLPVVFFVTDGLPSAGERSPERLADRAEDRLGRSRIFAFGVGHDVNTHLLDRLGQAGRGSTDYVQPGQDVERAVSVVAAKVRNPVLTDLELDDGSLDIRGIYPVRIPDVFAGQELVLFGRYHGQGQGRLVVSGRRNGATERFVAEVTLPARSEANAYLPRLWGSRKLGHLTRQLWTEGESPSLVEEIRAVALRYGLPSPYTSYLVEENQPVVTAAMPVRGRTGAGGNLPAAPVSVAAGSGAQGAVAVQRASEAGRFRDASRASELNAVVDELEQAKAADADGSTVRNVAGRLFTLVDGVWTEGGAGPAPTVHVRPFGSAWFRIHDALPELAPVLRRLGSVRVVGNGVDLLITAKGSETVTDQQFRRIVDALRPAVASR